MQHRAKQLTVFVNVHRGAFGPEAFETVHTSRHEAATAAEDYADSYLYTLTDAGKLDLTPEFSESYHEARDADAAVDAHIDQLKELESFTLHERA
jgi:hypothetical protein